MIVYILLYFLPVGQTLAAELEVTCLSLCQNMPQSMLFLKHYLLGHCMCKELPVIPVNKVVDPRKIIGKKWRAEEEERHKG
jgi:hypothetical protein